MQITALAVSLLLVGAHAQGLSDKNTIEGQCKKITRLARITSLAANDTQLAEKFGPDQARIDDFKAQAPEAARMLQELRANATLAQACPPIFAAQADGERCKDMQQLEETMFLAANETELRLELEDDPARLAEFREKLPARQAKLATMQANGTLTTFCAAREDRQSCRRIAKLEAMIEMSHNTTALLAKFEGNTTKIQRFQEKTTTMVIKLEKMTTNTTLKAMCAALPQAAVPPGGGVPLPEGGTAGGVGGGGGEAANGPVSGGSGVGSGISNGGTTRGGGTAEAVRSLGLRVGERMSPVVNLGVLAAVIFAVL